MLSQNNFSEYEDLIFPQDTILGKVSLLEVFQFYDLPLCFSSISNTGQSYLSTLCDYADISYPKWFLLPVSTERLFEIRSGSMDLHTAFITSETKHLYVTSRLGIELHKVVAIDTSLFPKPGIRLNIKTHSHNASMLDISDYAERTRRQIFDVSFENDLYTKTVFPIKALGQNLKAIQEIVNAVSYERKGYRNRRGRLPKRVLAETELGFVENYAASFGVRMIGLSRIRPLFGISIIEASLDKLMSILELPLEKNEAKRVLGDLNARAISKYMILLKMLAYSKTSISARIAFPGKEPRSARLDYQRAGNMAAILSEIANEEPMEYELQGKLIGLVVKSKRFEIETKMGDSFSTLAGSVLDPHLQDESYASINATYTFRIREEESFNVLSGESKKDFYLLEILGREDV